MEIEDRVLSILRENGRANFTEIAARLDIPTSSARTIVRRMLHSGAVQVGAIVNPELTRQEYRAHVSIWAVTLVDPVLALLESIPEVRFYSTIGGLFSVIAEVHAGSRGELQAILTRIRATAGVEAVSTVIYDRVYRYASLPVPPLLSEEHLDEIDRGLIRLLQENARATYRQLGAQLNLSSGAVFTRVQRLLETKIIQIGALVHRGPDSRNVAMGIGLNVYGDPETTAATIAELRSVEFVATGIGRFDIVATVSSSSLGELRSQLDEVHSRPEVASLETWVHLEILRESHGL